MDIQKQFDIVTGALNIFDMSYLISGATMLGVLVYAFPGFKDFVFHKELVILSVIACIVIAYVLGMICWIAGKQIRYWMMEHFLEKRRMMRISTLNLKKQPSVLISKWKLLRN